MLFLWFPGCNPEIERDEIAPGARAPSDRPTDIVCNDRNDPNAFEVDGFLFCADNLAKKVPVDDPIYVGCDEVPADARGEVLSLFDGVHARAWPLEGLHKREIVNDDFFGEPIVVDY
jgi:hypothetical protein